MCSCRSSHHRPLLFRRPVPQLRVAGMIALISLTLAVVASAGEFEASTAPDGRYLLRIYPRVMYTSAYFSDDGRAHNLPGVTGLLYLEIPVQVQYGLTGALSIGAMVPFGWTYEEEEGRVHAVSRLAVREVWLTIQHRWLTFPFVSSSSLRIKVPLLDKREWEDGLHIGDGQIDVYPAYHFDYANQAHYWYVQLAAGYKYRMNKGSYKPLDEFRLNGQGGYELFPDLRMRFYLLADLTSFSNGKFPAGDRAVFEREGNLHSFGYGVSLWPRPTFRVELTTQGDWSGTNQYRGIRWEIGFVKIL